MNNKHLNSIYSVVRYHLEHFLYINTFIAHINLTGVFSCDSYFKDNGSEVQRLKVGMRERERGRGGEREKRGVGVERLTSD